MNITVEVKRQPCVSVVVPAFNRASLLRQTMHSVLDQSLAEWELIVVDDGSTDDTLDVALEFTKRDRRVIAIPRERSPKGAPTCRNIGMEAAQGDFLLFLDSDDLLAPHCLETRVRQLTYRTDLEFMVFECAFFFEKPGDGDRSWLATPSDALTEFLMYPCWGPSSVLWRTESARRVGGWKEGLPSWQDWDWHVRALIQDLSFDYFNSSRPDSFCRRSEHPRITLQCDRTHLDARRQLFDEIRSDLERSGLLSNHRRAALAQNYIRLATNYHDSKLSAVGKDVIASIVNNALIDESDSKGLFRYYAFETNSMLRHPVLLRTVRKAIKWLYLQIFPQFVVRYPKMFSPRKRF